MIPVILSGGSGTRLWPVSRIQLPKQFCDLFGKSLHRLTLERLLPLGMPWVVTGARLKNLTLTDLTALKIDGNNCIFEPQAKNTAPAIASLCHRMMQIGKGEEVVGIFPADQLIERQGAFLEAVQIAEKLAIQGKIVTLGITPDHPATGFGYIQSGTDPYSVKAFHEKPSLPKAEAFLKEGGYSWNAGIFIFKVKTMADALAKHQPEIWKIAQSIKSDLSNLSEAFAAYPSISIDYAIIEKLDSQALSCVACDLGWSDVGSWDAIADIEAKRAASQSSVETNVTEFNSKHNYVSGQTGKGLQAKQYALVGCEDLVVVDTEDALLIAKRGTTQNVKEITDLLKKKTPKVLEEHVFEARPWGRFEILRDTADFKSKVIVVHPLQQLSYQSHAKRQEHWIITSGSGEVVLNDQIVPVKAGSHVHIPVGAKHRMRNTGAVDLQFVEVQLGTYFGEDDIVRYQDDYSRG